ncbi:tRNA cytosine(34) acetyltransferase [hydrothermal vent metagenome]|uniref:tRNA cytosine(34) acetyltransferase n=1 Tax=hydrothermal vent metagenome TaxID=652676 RepID=A0A3B0YR05_9ZZZZ
MSQRRTKVTGKAGISPEDALCKWRAELQPIRHRGLVWISGSRQDTRATLDTMLDVRKESAIWCGNDAPDGVKSIAPATSSAGLGAECDVLVFDAESDFDPDAFGALSGTVRGGGLVFLLTPTLEDWPEQPDRHSSHLGKVSGRSMTPPRRYLKRLTALLTDAPEVLWIDEGVVRSMPEFVSALAVKTKPVPPPCMSTDQVDAVSAVMHVVTGHRRRPVVLRSDRGRGKSVAFGIAAARLVSEQGKRVLVTAARRSAVDALMQQAMSMLTDDQSKKLKFVAPDALAREPQDADLLLVDEAASIPAPLLEILLKQYSRIAFATTVHGYEGTGRGFALRFNRVLDCHTNSWKTVKLQTPIRWSADDPLEALVFRLLMLDAGAASDGSLCHADPAQALVECVDRNKLAQDESLLRELFGLLVLAHYKTRPSDLRQLLDAPNLSVYLMRVNGHVAAAALVAREGNFDHKQAEEIVTGKRRPVGHLLPESLAIHLGMVDAPLQCAARVVRIAVHPAIQVKGFGSQLLTHIEDDAQRDGVDYIGASFSANADLLGFWSKAGWQPVRTGEQRSASSGSHSVMVMKGLSEKGGQLFASTRQRFLRHFPHQLSDSLRDLEAALVIALMRDAPDSVMPLTEDDLEDVRRFAFEQRFPESAIGALWPWLCNRLMSPQSLTLLNEIDTGLLIMRILQKQTWHQCAAHAGLSGHDQTLGRLRESVRQLMD